MSHIEGSEARKAIIAAINSNGYGLQHAVVAEARSAYESGKSGWIFEVAELPVHVGGKDGRIDIVLKNSQENIFLTIECKRVNPLFARWIFLRAPMLWRNPPPDRWYFDRTNPPPHSMTPMRSSGAEGYWLSKDRTFHIGLLAKSRQGESEGSRSPAIEEACTQSIIASKGLLEHWSTGVGYHSDDRRPRIVLPVVVTNATLIGSLHDLAQTDIDSGHINEDSFQFTVLPWLYYQYPASQTIQHQYRLGVEGADLAELTRRVFWRTIPIVTASKVGDFLGSLTAESIT